LIELLFKTLKEYIVRVLVTLEIGLGHEKPLHTSQTRSRARWEAK